MHWKRDARPCSGWAIGRSICRRSSIATCILLDRLSGACMNCMRCSEERKCAPSSAARGGYGCNYLLPHLDLNLIRRNPKIFVGCSDVTTLLTYLCDAAGLVTFHGPMAAGDFGRPDGVDEDAWFAAVSSGKKYRARFHRGRGGTAGERRSRGHAVRRVSFAAVRITGHPVRDSHRVARFSSWRISTSRRTESTVC